MSLPKAKDHKQYEYGNKVSIVSTKDTNIIVGVASHDKNIHDSKTLTVAISHANRQRNNPSNKRYATEAMLVQR
ncbi:hypothetical protein BSPWISOXPB_1900 [uncultured Gammaproteobacteria bacterium]|nr:hypothetical protein BSPWISOXPB_1900 [uncultured Gammaproteobacteria bacterium]